MCESRVNIVSVCYYRAILSHAGPAWPTVVLIPFMPPVSPSKVVGSAVWHHPEGYSRLRIHPNAPTLRIDNGGIEFMCT